MALALGGTAWAAFTHFETTGVSGIVLKNNTTDQKNNGAVFQYRPLERRVSVLAPSSAYDLYLYFSDGAKWESTPAQIVSNIDFTLNYVLMNDSSQGTPSHDNDATVEFYDGNGGAFILPLKNPWNLSADKALPSFSASYNMHTIGTVNPFVRIQNKATIKKVDDVYVVPTRFNATTAIDTASGGVNEGGSGSRLLSNASYGNLFLNSNYGFSNPGDNPLIPASLKVTVSAQRNSAPDDVYWHIKPIDNATRVSEYVKITTLSTGNANGLSGLVRENQAYRAAPAAQYSLDQQLYLEFSGKPVTTGVHPEFTITGTMADMFLPATAPTDRLSNVQTYLQLPTPIDSGINLDKYSLSFVRDREYVLGEGLAVMYTSSTAPLTTYGAFRQLIDADIFDDKGRTLITFDGNNVGYWNGMRVERSFHQNTITNGTENRARGVTFTFSGTPTATVDTKFYIGARTRGTIPAANDANGNFSGPFLFGPVAVKVIGPTTTTPELRANPDIMSMVVGTNETKTAAITNASTGSAVNITSISRSDTVAGSSLSDTWHSLSISVSGSTVTVSGNPDSVGSQTFYIYDGTGAKPAPLTINVTSPSAASLIPTPATISGIVSKDLTTKSVAISSASGTATVTAVSPTKWNGLTLSYSGSNVTISGVPDAKMKETFNVNASVNGVPANPTSFTIDIAAQPALTLTPNSVSGVAGTSLGEKLISVGASGATGTIEVTGLTQSSSTTGKSIKWNDLTISASGSTITVTGTPATSDSTDITVSGTVGGTAASTATLRISVATAGTPQLQLDSSAASATVGSAMTTKTFNVTGSIAGTVVVNGVTGGTQTSVSKDFTWKGLAIKTDGTKVTVSGTPTETGSGTFTVSGTVGGVTAQTATFTVTISAASAPTLFQSSASWKANRTDYSYELWIPVTSAFVTAFDANKDGKVTKDELQKVLADMNHPYASLISTVFDMINDDGSAYGTLYLKSNFNPASGHTADWYVNMILKGLDIIGTNGTTYGNDFSNIVLESIQRYHESSGGSSGCDAGFGALALLALGAAVVLRKKD